MFAASKTNNVATGGQKDPQFKYVTMLLHGDGTNGAQNNTFLDSSTNNFTITRNGNTTQGSFSPYGSNWSNYLGTGNYLTWPSGSSVAFGTGDFTVECWLYLGATPTTNFLFDFRDASNTTAPAFIWGNNTSGVLDWTQNAASGPSISSNSATWNINTWYHIAYVRNGTTGTIYQNGVSVGSGTDSTNYTVTPATSRIAARYATPFLEFPNGYISNVRIVKGTAVYTGSFTPSTTPLTAITNTVLLTCQSNRFIDNSTNAYAITVTGTPSVQRFNPFGTSTAYSTSVIGGSGYFDGAGDTLLVPYSSVMNTAGAYSFETWVYFTGSNASQGVIGTTSDGFAGFERSAGNWAYYYGISGIGTGVACVLNQWNHVVICRNAGGSGGFFVNGIRLATFTDTANKTSFGNLQIGYNGVAGGAYTTGYISEYRFVQGNPYDPTSSTLTVPTAPLTAISGTVALLNMTNGAIYDNAMMNNLETVGNAQISTSVVKYGTGSMAFDGTGDSLLSTGTLNAAFGTGDFTIEFWLNPNTIIPLYQGIIDTRPAGGASANAFLIYLAAGGTLYYFSNGANVVSYSTISTGTWIHVAITRSSGSVRLFINGTISGSAVSYTQNLSETRIIVGSSYDNFDFNGYIDDLRLTKGYARYTANFTAPTAAFPNTGPV